VTEGSRWRNARWISLGLIVIGAVATIGALLTAPTPGGLMDPDATSSAGAHALVTLLRDHGVDVTVAENVDDVERAATSGSLLLMAESYYARGDDLLNRLAVLPVDRLLVEPTARARETLAPGIRLARSSRTTDDPNCDLREANTAGVTQLGPTEAYTATGDTAVTRCYGGALVRYHADGRTITVVGTSDFMTNGSLLKEGNAALAMNLAGASPHLIWYSPQRAEGDSSSGSTISDLIPEAVTWIVWQLCFVVVLLAIWRGRRLGPLVAEKLPVVVRASETVEGRARLYRARRARTEAADSLRTAALHRLTPRLGLGARPSPSSVVAAVTRHCGGDPNAMHYTLFGPAPATDAELLDLAHALDYIERQVTSD